MGLESRLYVRKFIHIYREVSLKPNPDARQVLQVISSYRVTCWTSGEQVVKYCEQFLSVNDRHMTADETTVA
jgi:NADH:ubiquinone oxidoreductase subunit E